MANEVNRFWSKVEVTDGCWLWTAFTNKKGYGQMRVGGRAGRTVKAHRFSFMLHFGPISDLTQVNHHCDNPQCVRPIHLYAGTQLDNMRDMARRGRHPNQAKTHCPQGHVLQSRNKRGKRWCQECHTEANRKWNASLKTS